MYCDTFPLLPDRLTYPDFIPAAWREACLYQDYDELLVQLRRRLVEIDRCRHMTLRESVSIYDWSIMAGEYDEQFQAV